MLKGKDMLSIHDLSVDEVQEILALAKELKAKQKAGVPHEILKGKTLGMIFEKSSTRTRVSFETGMYQLGGQALFLSNRDLQLGRGEPIRDTARVLSRYLDGIMIRTFGHDRVEELAKWADIPVINALTDLLHPCQVLTDLLTIEEYKGKNLKGLKMAYVGDGNNMTNSFLYGCAKVGMTFVAATPEDYRPDETVVSMAMRWPMTRPVLPRTSSETSGFFFCGIIEEPVQCASSSSTKWNSRLHQRIVSSERRERWTMRIEAAARNSMM